MLLYMAFRVFLVLMHAHPAVVPAESQKTATQ
jgi:hypothetical protein